MLSQEDKLAAFWSTVVDKMTEYSETHIPEKDAYKMCLDVYGTTERADRCVEQYRIGRNVRSKYSLSFSRRWAATIPEMPEGVDEVLTVTAGYAGANAVYQCVWFTKRDKPAKPSLREMLAQYMHVAHIRLGGLEDDDESLALEDADGILEVLEEYNNRKEM